MRKEEVPVTTNCPHCDTQHSFSEGSFGRKVWCRSCGSSFPLPTQGAYSRKLWSWVICGLAMAGMVIVGVVWFQEYLESKRHPPVQTQASLEIPALKDQLPSSSKNAEEEAAELLRKAKELIAEKKFEKAKRCLKELLNNFPATPAAKEAHELLEFLR